MQSGDVMIVNFNLFIFILLYNIVTVAYIRIKPIKKEKSLKWNLNFRRVSYSFNWLTNLFCFFLCLDKSSDFTSMELSSVKYFVCLILIFICLVFFVFFIDRNNVKKKLKPYILENTLEYYYFTLKDIDRVWRSSFYCATLTALFALMPIAVLLE